MNQGKKLYFIPPSRTITDFMTGIEVEVENEKKIDSDDSNQKT